MTDTQLPAAFICACGHSGTTLVATMLAMHPEIFVPLRESKAFWGDDPEKIEKRLTKLRDQTRSAGKSMLVEKTPRHIRLLDRIKQHTPGARLILMTRDGRDVAASIGKRTDGNYQAGVNRWVKDNNYVIGETANRLAYLLRYEDLIDDPARELAALCSFLGVDYDPAMLDYHRQQHLWFGKQEVRETSGVGDEHEDLRNWQVNQPIFDARGTWRTRLPDEFAEQFSRGPALRIMQAFGYGENGSTGRRSGPLGR